MKIKTRIFNGFGVAALVTTLALGLLAYTQMRTIKATAIRITGDTMPSIYLSGQLQSITLLRYSLLTDYVDRAGEAENAELVGQIDSDNAQIDAVMREYESLIDVPADARLFATLKAARTPYDECFIRVLQLRREGKRDQALALIETELVPLRNAFLKAAKAEVDWNKTDADDSAHAITAAVSWTSIGFLIGLALISGIAWIVMGIRGQLRIETALRESEERFHQVFAHAPVGIYVAQRDGRLIQVNEALSKMLGYSKQELLEKTWPELCPPEDLAAALLLKQHLWEGAQGRAEMERRYIHRDGTIVWCNTRISMLRAPDGSSLYSVVHVEDVTERRRGEQALRESEERFHSMADACPSMMWVTGPSGGLDFVNKECRRFFGVTSEEVQADKWHSLFHPDDAPQYIAAFARAQKDHTLFRAEARVRRGDGEWRLLGSNAQPHFSPAGEYLGHIGLSADITERMQAEQERQFHHSLISAIYEGSVDGILVVNADDFVVSHNQRFLDIWKATYPEVPGNPPGSIAGMTLQAALSLALQQVKDPEAYLKRIQAIQDDADATDRCEVELKDGATLERYSVSLRSKSGQHLGRARFFRDITERKQAGQALLESEKRFRIMADGCPAPMWVANAAGEIEFINRAFREFFGHAGQLSEGSNWQSLIYPEDAPGFVRECFSALDEHRSFRAEVRVRRADGEWRWFSAMGEPRFSETREFLGHIGLGIDSTERKQAEKALLESEERFRIMADSCPIGIWVTDAQGKVRFINQAYRKSCGIASELIASGEWRTMIHPDDADRFIEVFERALREHTSFTAERRSRCPKGNWRWMESDAVPRFSSDGEFLGLVGTSRDITSRKRAEQALQQSEERFRQLTENIHEVFWLKAPGAEEFLYVSPAYEQVWGRSCASIYQDPASRLEAIHPDDLEPSRTLFARQMAGEAVETEYRIRTPEGQEKWIRGRAFPIHDKDGKLIRIAGIAEDITERKQAMQALQISEEKFRQLAENIQEVFFVMTPSGLRCFISAPRMSRFGAEPGQRLPEPDVLGGGDPSRRPGTSQSIGRAGKYREKPSNRNTAYERRKGRRNGSEADAFPIRDQAGELIRIVGIAEEITEQKRYEAELIRAREER